MKGFKLDKCQRRCESRDNGQNGCRYRDSEGERPICSLRHYSSPSSPNSGTRNNPEQGRLYGDGPRTRKVHLNENRVVAYAFTQGSLLQGFGVGEMDLQRSLRQAHVCFGSKQTLQHVRTMSALPPKAD